MLVMTCILFMMTYSSLLGTPSFSRKLSVFVDENNFSNEYNRDLIVKINKVKQKNSLFLLFEKNQNTVFYKNSDKIPKNIGNISAFLMKKDENNLRTRE